MLETLKELDKELFIFLNNLQFDFLNPIMLELSARRIWYVLFIFLFVFVVYKEKIKGFFTLFQFGIIGILCLGISTLSKPFFAQIRPCYEKTLTSQIQILGHIGEYQYGFFSSHATLSFGLAVFFVKKFPSNWSHLVVVLAFFISYSRIYVGVHYVSDILIGALVGYCIAFIAFRFVLFAKKHMTINNLKGLFLKH